MHGTGNAAPVALEVFGGLFTQAGPTSLPEGASPRCYDVDFTVGGVNTRPPIENVYTFENTFQGPNLPHIAGNDIIAGGNNWQNPGALLSVTPNDTATVTVSVPLLPVVNAPGGVTNTGTGQLSAENATIPVRGPLSPPTGPFLPPAPGVPQAALSIQSYFSSALLLQQFTFAPVASVAGVTVQLTGFVSGVTASNAIIGYAQLTYRGSPIGAARAFYLQVGSIGPAFWIPGGNTPNDTWGASLAGIVNDPTFGVQIIINSGVSTASMSIASCSMTLYASPGTADFNYIGNFKFADGSLRNLCLDTNGNLYYEDCTAQPGVLQTVVSGIAPRAYAKGTGGTNAAYLAISDLTQGIDAPKLYTPNWVDRISQVGPGAPPTFTATIASVGSGVAITNYSIASNIVSFTASNSFAAGQVITLSGFTGPTFLNGLVLDVLGSGLSGTGFQVYLNHANVSSTAATGIASPQYQYPIAASPKGITQLAARTYGFAFLLWSAGAGSVQAGNTITIYYADSTLTGPDTQLVNNFNSGQAVYVYITGAPIGNGTNLVTSVGKGAPPNQSRQFYYFTIQMTSSQYAYYTGQNGYGVTYQMTAATLTTAVPVPDLTVNNQVNIAGAGVSQWNSQWTISQTLNAAAMTITQTSMTSGVAVYSYAVIGTGGGNPAAGQLVTVSNTLNGNGVFNVTDVPISTVSGTNVGTFTVTGFPSSDTFGTSAESGQATTAGTQFVFDPGALTVGTQNNPIYGNSGGGALTVAGTGQVIGSGTRQGVVFFITRNGYETAPSPPVTFTTPTNSNYIYASGIPIGPPNVIARGIAFTEAGQNGVAGANFFTIPQQVNTTINGVTSVSTALLVNDNVTTSARFSFTDTVLLSAEAIDIQGNNLFNLIEIGNPGWVASYAGRNFYGLCQNKIQNFLNLSFDGGYLPSSTIYPLGWQIDSVYGQYGQLIVSGAFGNSYYIQNSTNVVQNGIGMIRQSAYQDAYQQPIININTLYSVRVTARIPSGITGGLLAVSLTEYNLQTGYGSEHGVARFGLEQFNSSTFQTITLPMTITAFTTAVPSDLVLRVYGYNFSPGADIEIDRIDVFPTEIPVLTTQAFVSYVNNPESVDGVTGVIRVDQENQQPWNGLAVMNDQAYILKSRSWYATQNSANDEPANWEVREVSQKAGAEGINSFDVGEGWIITHNRYGAYLFTGGQPKKISLDVDAIFQMIPDASLNSVWVRNDPESQRLYFGVPLPTPNFYLPNAGYYSLPPYPNVILMMNYQSINTGDELQDAMEVHSTMFGNLQTQDMRRKWSIWQIPCPYADLVKQVEGGSELFLGNGLGTSKIYRFGEYQTGIAPTDDGQPITSCYVTYPWVSSAKATSQPLLGFMRKTWEYLVSNVSGVGLLNVTLYPNILLGPGDLTTGYQPWTVPGGIQLVDPSFNDRECTLNFTAQRTFVEFKTTGYMAVDFIVMFGKKAVWNAIRGIK